MRKNMLTCLLVAAILSFTGLLYAAHTDYHCGDCHQPHRNFDANADATDYGVPLYNGINNADGVTQYDIYSSHWFDKYGITVGQPTGATKLCLGCHDGTGGHISHEFGTADLKNSHPVSINYEEARLAGADLHDPTSTSELTPLGGTINVDLLDDRGDVQCTSCHDVHSTASSAIEGALKFDPGNRFIALCKSCHKK